jgi:hypothetical protein
MRRIIRLTETDLKRIVRRVIRESGDPIVDPCQNEVNALTKLIGGKLPAACMGSDMESECLSELMTIVDLTNIQKIRTAVANLYDCREENSGMMY